MNKTALKTDMLSAISDELDLWLDKEGTIRDGYDYETEFMNMSRKVNQILMSKSLGTVTTNRNKKNSKPVLGSSK